jgi:hypothetical protein
MWRDLGEMWASRTICSWPMPPVMGRLALRCARRGEYLVRVRLTLGVGVGVGLGMGLGLGLGIGFGRRGEYLTIGLLGSYARAAWLGLGLGLGIGLGMG